MQKDITKILLGFILNLFLGLFLWYILITGLGVYLYPIVLALVFTGLFFAWFWRDTSLSFWQKGLYSWVCITINHFLFFGFLDISIITDITWNIYLILGYFPFIVIGIWMYSRLQKTF